MTADPQDIRSKLGAGYEDQLTGAIFFKPGIQPNLVDVERAGQECFDYGFQDIAPIRPGHHHQDRDFCACLLRRRPRPLPVRLGDPAVLQALQALKTAATPEDLKRVWT
jgi:hypothetical protein